jgi:hypothetical protein
MLKENTYDLEIFYFEEDDSILNNQVGMHAKSPRKIHCNLCDKEFKPRNKFERFCDECKIENESYLDYEDYYWIS